jgi:ABC-type transport system, involved in lipoprotein release, permease component
MIRLAWRNIWRNKRRTLITTASIFFGVVLSAYMTSMQEGSYDQYIKAIVNFYSGYLQIHQKGFWDNKVINNTFELSRSINKCVKKSSGITVVAPRLETFALGSAQDITKVVMMIGISPGKENAITRLKIKLVHGQYLSENDNGILVGSALAKYMKLEVNDTLIVIGQGYHGVSAAGKYPVRGIVKQPSPELDRSVVYMELAHCQDLFSASNRLTSLVMMVADEKMVAPAKAELTKSLGNNYEVMDWKEMNSLLLSQIDADRSGGIIFKAVLYMIIAFGILGTVIMMIAERKKEMGMMIAVGMQKMRLAWILLLETIFMGVVGIIAGVAVSIPLTYYFTQHPIYITGQAGETLMQMGFEPILSFSMAPRVFYNQAVVILVIALVIGLYPVVSILRMNIIKALRK